MIARRRFHRAVFLCAGLYNICWGVYSVAEPQWFFTASGMVPSNRPEIFACLGMVIALYGVLYLDVARRPEEGWLVAAVGLTGKILGPIGAVRLVWTGDWPPASLAMVVTNDAIWWLPFALYLWDSRPPRRDGGREESHRRALL